MLQLTSNPGLTLTGFGTQPWWLQMSSDDHHRQAHMMPTAHNI